MARTEEANQRLREAQRANILKSASLVFARKGRAATMADVAEEAGVSQGLAYRYFPNKEALFQELVEQTMQDPAASILRWLEQPGRPEERLFALVAHLVESRRQRPAFFQMLNQALGDEAMSQRLHELVQRQAQTLQEVLRQLIVEGQAQGSVRATDPDQLVRAICVYLDGLARAFTLYGPEQFHGHFPDAEILLHMLRP